MADTVTFNFDKQAILKGVMVPSLQDWSGFFENLRYQQYRKISQCKSEEERIEVQQSIRGLNHTESVFRQMHDTKKFS